MPGPPRLARVMAGEGASEEELVRWWYRIDLFEHRLWYGQTKPFPEFDEWLDAKLAEVK